MNTASFQKQHGDDFPEEGVHGADMDAPIRIPSGGVKKPYTKTFGFFPEKHYSENVSLYILTR